MERVTAVYVVCGFEPLRVGLARVIEENPDTHLRGSYETVASLGRVMEHDAVLLVETSQIHELTRFESSSGREPFQHVVFVGNLPSGVDPGGVITSAVSARSGVAFLAESGRAERILEAISLVQSNVLVCELPMAKSLQARDTGAEARNRLMSANLSPRERDVLVFVAQGLANKEIARELRLAEGTVKAHVSHILNKLGVATRVDLVRYALLLSNGVDQSSNAG